MICTNFLGHLVSRHDKFGAFLVRYFGIGSRGARILCRASGLSYNAYIAPTATHKILFLENLVNSSYVKEFELRRIISANLFFKYSNGSIPGLRLSQGLPTRFQRSKTNAKTSKRLRIDLTKLS